ncbi:MAG: hypothetical protein EA409_04245 [Saprospirales bacterium]|nr:MAG: hypothetical protein EA409_04245 [Saprospirales bacterium]
MKEYKSIIVFVSLLLLLLLTGCGESPRPPLNEAQRTMRDSISTLRLQEASVEMDSICNQRLDRLVVTYYDSIMEVRINEIRKLRSRR